MPKRKGARGRGRGGKGSSKKPSKENVSDVAAVNDGGDNEDKIPLEKKDVSAKNDFDKSDDLDSKTEDAASTDMVQDVVTELISDDNEEEKDSEVKQKDGDPSGPEKVQDNKPQESYDEVLPELEKSQLECDLADQSTDIAPAKGEDADKPAMLNVEGSTLEDVEIIGESGATKKSNNESGDVVEEVVEVEEAEELYVDEKEVDEDVQYIDEEIEDGEQDLLDVIELDDSEKVILKEGNKDEKDKKEETVKETKVSTSKPSVSGKGDLKSKSEVKECAGDTTFEEISEGSMDPMEQEEVIEAISDNEIMIVEASSQEEETEKEKRDKKKKTSSPVQEDETLADIFLVTENEDDQLAVVANDKDNDDISDVSLCNDDDRNDLSLEEISDDELESSRKRKSDVSQQEGNKSKENDDGVENISKEESALEESEDKDAGKKRPNEEEPESSTKRQKLEENEDKTEEKPIKLNENASVLSKESEKPKEFPPRTSSWYKQSHPTQPPPSTKSTATPSQTQTYSRRGKIIQCSINPIVGLRGLDKDNESYLKNTALKIQKQYKPYLPSSVETIFPDVVSTCPPNPGSYSLSLGPVTVADLENAQFRDICMSSAVKLNLSFNSKTQGVLQAHFTQYSDVSRIIHRLKGLDLGIRYMIMSLMHRTAEDGPSKGWKGFLWQALLIFTYNPDNSEMMAWDAKDGKVRSQLCVTGVPKNITKDFVHLIFPEALYISSQVGREKKRNLVMGFSSTKTSRDICMCYDLLLFNNEKVAITPMDPSAAKSEIGSASEPGFIEEDGMVIVPDAEEGDASGDSLDKDSTSGHPVRETEQKEATCQGEEEDQDVIFIDETVGNLPQPMECDESEKVSTVQKEKREQQGLTEEANSETAPHNIGEEDTGTEDNTDGAKSERQNSDKILRPEEKVENENVDKGEKTQNENVDKGEKTQNEDVDKGEKTQNENVDKGEKTQNEDVDKGEKTQNEDVDKGEVENEKDERVGNNSVNDLSSCNTQSSGKEDPNHGAEIEANTDDKWEVVNDQPSGPVCIDEGNMGPDNSGALKEAGQSVGESTVSDVERANQDEFGKDGSGEEDKTRGQSCKDNVEDSSVVETTPQTNTEPPVTTGPDLMEASGDVIGQNGEELKDACTEGSVTGGAVVSSGADNVKDIETDHQGSETIEGKQSKTVSDKDDSLEDVSDDEMIPTEAKGEEERDCNEFDDDEVIILKEEPSKKVVATIDLTEEEVLKSSETNNGEDGNQGENNRDDKVKVKDELKEESLVDEDRLTITDGDFQVVMESIDVEEEEIDYAVLYSKSGTYRGKYYNYNKHFYRPNLVQPLLTGPANQRPPYNANPWFRGHGPMPPRHRWGEPMIPRRPAFQRPPMPRFAPDFRFESVYGRSEKEVKDNAPKRLVVPSREMTSERRDPIKRDYVEEKSAETSSRHASVPSREMTSDRREPMKRDYRRAKSPSPRNNAAGGELKDTYPPAYATTAPSKQTAYNYTSTPKTRPSSYREPKSAPSDSQQAVHYEYKNSSRPNSRFEPSSAGGSAHREEYRPQKPAGRTEHSKSRSFSPLSPMSAGSAELLLRTSPQKSKTSTSVRRVSHSPISASSRSLSPVSRSPSPQARPSRSSRYSKGSPPPPRHHRDRYPVSSRDHESDRITSTHRRSRSPSSYKSWERRRSRSPVYRRRPSSPPSNREKMMEREKMKEREKLIESKSVVSQSRSSDLRRKNQDKKISLSNKINTSFVNTNSIYKKLPTGKGGTAAAQAQNQSDTKSKSQQSEVGSYGQAAASVSYTMTQTAGSATVASANYSVPSSYLPPPPQPPMFYSSSTIPPSYQQYSLGMNAATAGYSAYAGQGATPVYPAPYMQAASIQHHQQQHHHHHPHAVTNTMYSYPQAQTAMTNMPPSASISHTHTQPQGSNISHSSALSGVPKGAQPVSSVSFNKQTAAGYSHSQNAAQTKHWSIGDGGNALMFQRILSKNKSDGRM